MFSHYQEVNNTVNMTMLDLLIIYKRKLIYGTTFYHKEIQDQILCKKRSREVPSIAPVIIRAAEY